MRHPWISAARPKFVFNGPVSALFPEIREAYAAKISHPMDLTTAECKLLQGKIYSSAQDFIDDVALVFNNAITFNKGGQEQGEPMSCAYYDVSRHLLRYSRWLSLEHLAPFLEEDDLNESSVGDGPISHWKLVKSNRKGSQKEMENIVFNQILEKSDKGDRYTWMEAECEKLLKCLRHQTDAKHMMFFVQPNYPPDYLSFISKPMAWDQCQEKLKRRKYNTFRDIVDDLRLIFANAIKYNSQFKGTNSDSQRAYESAQHMLRKLEYAIDRLLITVSDRLERDKIDKVIYEREMEAAEREEEQRLRTEWQKERERARSSLSGGRGEQKSTTTVTTVETVKVVTRRAPIRRDIDFEFPFYDEESNHETSQQEALKHQKHVFEMQQRARQKMHSDTMFVGLNLFDKLQERANAIRWSQQLAAKIMASLPPTKPKKLAVGSISDGMGNPLIPSRTMSEDSTSRQGGHGGSHRSHALMKISEQGRSQVKLTLGKGLNKGKKKKGRKKIDPIFE